MQCSAYHIVSGKYEMIKLHAIYCLNATSLFGVQWSTTTLYKYNIGNRYL